MNKQELSEDQQERYSLTVLQIQSIIQRVCIIQLSTLKKDGIISGSNDSMALLVHLTVRPSGKTFKRWRNKNFDDVTKLFGKERSGRPRNARTEELVETVLAERKEANFSVRGFVRKHPCISSRNTITRVLSTHGLFAISVFVLLLSQRSISAIVLSGRRKYRITLYIGDRQ